MFSPHFLLGKPWFPDGFFLKNSASVLDFHYIIFELEKQLMWVVFPLVRNKIFSKARIIAFYGKIML